MKTLEGKVVNNKMEKTIVVKVDRIWHHPIYKKGVKRSKKYSVVDNLGVEISDKVVIGETRPISKTKRWKVVKIIK